MYDTETGFYYLQSRYYDPEIARFINADDFASTGQGILGHNMFAYCGNNPVNNKDSAGQFSIDAKQEADTITVTIHDTGRIGFLDYVIVVEAEFDLVEDFTFNWGDYCIYVGGSGITVVTPLGHKESYAYRTGAQIPQSIEIPIDPNMESPYLKLSSEGIGFGAKYEKGIQTYSTTIYPRIFSSMKQIAKKLPSAPPAGGYSNFGTGTSGGLIMPLRNPTLKLM